MQFDLSWSNSWRAAWTPVDTGVMVTNWDAAWVFVKYRQTGVWEHATLTTSGHTAPAGCVIDAAADGTGAFIYRSAAGSGGADYPNVKLRWSYAADGGDAQGSASRRASDGSGQSGSSEEAEAAAAAMVIRSVRRDCHTIPSRSPVTHAKLL